MAPGPGVTGSPAATSSASGTLWALQTEKLDGTPGLLSEYRGQVVLVVNTASECGFTPQYQGLEALYQRYKSRGFAVLGFPSNDFGGQEPLSNAEIASFCANEFRITFPMFGKVVTTGEAASPIYKFVSRTEGEPKWNFHKYLVGRDGRVIDSFISMTTPDSDRLTSAIETALAAPVPAAK